MAARIGDGLIDDLARRHAAAQLVQRRRDLGPIGFRLRFEITGACH